MAVGRNNLKSLKLVQNIPTIIGMKRQRLSRLTTMRSRNFSNLVRITHSEIADTRSGITDTRSRPSGQHKNIKSILICATYHPRLSCVMFCE